jgi:hypothetical protein
MHLILLKVVGAENALFVVLANVRGEIMSDKENNVISLAKKKNLSVLFTTRDLLTEIIGSDEPEKYKNCFCIVSDTEKTKDNIVYRFNYYTAGFESRLELLGLLDLIRQNILSELYDYDD